MHGHSFGASIPIIGIPITAQNVDMIMIYIIKESRMTITMNDKTYELVEVQPEPKFTVLDVVRYNDSTAKKEYSNVNQES